MKVVYCYPSLSKSVGEQKGLDVMLNLDFEGKKVVLRRALAL